jgi:hypothetical protein
LPVSDQVFIKVAGLNITADKVAPQEVKHPDTHKLNIKESSTEYNEKRIENPRPGINRFASHIINS